MYDSVMYDTDIIGPVQRRGGSQPGPPGLGAGRAKTLVRSRIKFKNSWSMTVIRLNGHVVVTTV